METNSSATRGDKEKVSSYNTSHTRKDTQRRQVEQCFRLDGVAEEEHMHTHANTQTHEHTHFQ